MSKHNDWQTILFGEFVFDDDLIKLKVHPIVFLMMMILMIYVCIDVCMYVRTYMYMLRPN